MPYYALLALMVVAGLGLRLWQLPARGLHTHDEGRFLIVADSYLNAADTAISGGNLDQFGESLRRQGGSFFAHAKEGHIFMLAAWRLLTGRSVAASALLSVIFSLGAALILYRLIEVWLRRAGPGIVAAAALLVSPLAIHYSRSVLSEASSLFFLLAAFLAAFQCWKGTKHGEAFSRSARLAIIAGIAAGLSFACHYNKAVMLALAGVIWIVAASRANEPRRKAHFQALALLAAGFLIPILAIQLITLIVSWKAGNAYPEFKTYFGDLWYHFTTFHTGPGAGGGESQSRGGVNPFFGLALLVQWRGWTGAALMLATLAAGCWMAVRPSREAEFLQPLLILLLPLFVFFSFYRFQVERSFAGLEAFWAALAGVVWFAATEKLFATGAANNKSSRPVLTTACLCAVIIVITLPFAIRVIRHDASTFRQAARELAPVLISADGRVTAGSVTWHVKPQWIVYLNRELESRLDDKGELSRYVDWSAGEIGDYLLIEEFVYADSPLFPPDLTAGREPMITIPAQAFTPAIRIYDLRSPLPASPRSIPAPATNPQ